MEVVLHNVYAVIVSWNGARWIQGALESLRRSTFPVRVVVVDNASTDETIRIIHDLYPEAELLCMPANLGFGRANNRGIHYALSQGADYVLLLNQDAKVEPAMIGMLADVLDKHPDFGIASPLHLDYRGIGIDPGFLTYVKNDTCLMSDAFLGRLQELYEVPFVPAAIWLLSRRALDEVEGFNPIFFMYGEDLDFCDRVRAHGFKVALVPKALAFHEHHRCDGDLHHTFGTRCANLYALLLYRVTRPHCHSFRDVGKVLLCWIRESIITLLNLEFTSFFARVLALLKILTRPSLLWQRHDQLGRNLLRCRSLRDANQ